MSKAVTISIPQMHSEITLSPAWVQTRDELIAESQGITVEDQVQYDAASGLLNRITKHSRGLEKVRKEYAKPFQDAAKVIKVAADEARLDLEKTKAEVQKKLEVFATEARKREAEARREAERKAQEEAEKAMAEHQTLVDLGLADEDDEVEVPAAEMTVIEDEARNSATRAMEDVKFEISDEGKVPRPFLSVDEKKVRAYIKDHKDEIKKRLEIDPDCPIIHGIRVFTKLRVQSS